MVRLNGPQIAISSRSRFSLPMSPRFKSNSGKFLRRENAIKSIEHSGSSGGFIRQVRERHSTRHSSRSETFARN